ncbi:MAG: chemotaxis response regulator protein-glutamate methylesterase [candidate division Zixibacteria bacterium]|nr:chemotaxis response regulator protein-glutamate methylesterase [candidate division Zixibacteria bacterium]MDH4032727.1 chemotaxis response regulator protein-glutamate methylesterase [candidate division Zixibacteria bacterium]
MKVLVVDDSAFMRKALSMMLESDPGIKVIGTARDGEEGIEKVRNLKPDLVTMDIEMPRMDGLAALREIMNTCPLPVMMISSLTTDGASATLDALEMGAVDFIPKQLSFVSLDIVKIKDELLAKIKDIARRKNVLMACARRANFARLTDTRTKPSSTRPSRRVVSPTVPIKSLRKRNHLIGLVAVGSSTGGPPALQNIIPRLPRNLPVGIVIAQHMPATFTTSLAERLDKLSKLSVKEAEDGDKIEPGTVLVAPGGRQMTIKRSTRGANVHVGDQPTSALYKPCVDVMMNSVVNAYGSSTMGVILTGMGSNGVAGLKNVKSKGGVVLAQNEETCVVYGMPRAAVEAGVTDHIVPIEIVADEIMTYF